MTWIVQHAYLYKWLVSPYVFYLPLYTKYGRYRFPSWLRRLKVINEVYYDTFQIIRLYKKQ